MDLSTLFDPKHRFWKTDHGRKMWAEAERAEEDDRQRIAAQSGLVARAERKKREIPPLVKAKNAAQAAVDNARADLRAAEKKLNAASLALMSREQTIANEESRLEKLLRDTSAPILRPFLDRVDAEIERMTRKDALEIRREVMAVGYNVARGPIHQVVERDNTAQLKARVERLVEARAQACRLCSTRADVTASELEALLDDLPDWHLES